MRKYERKSARFWAKTWKRAVKKGVCPIDGCSIKLKTCEHLDGYLGFGRGLFEGGPADVSFEGADIEAYAGDDMGDKTEGTWRLFKKLRRAGLIRDEIRVIFDRVILEKTYRQMQIERGWVDPKTAHRFYKRAIDKLRARNLKEILTEY